MEPGGTSEPAGQKDPPEAGALAEGRIEARPRGHGGDSVDHKGPMSCGAEGKRRRGGSVCNVPDSRKRLQVRGWRRGLS